MRDTERDALERLKQLGGPSLARELAGLYVEQTAGRVQSAQAALRDGDFPALVRAAHAIRSSSAQLGANEITALCESLEDAAEAGDLAQAGQDLTDVAEAFRDFSEWLLRATGADAGDASANGEPVDAQSAAGHRPTIAVIEDNADNRLLVDAILGDLYALDEYATGAEALASMPSRPPALVLLDVSLPGLDGLEVLARIRADSALGTIPVVAVTAHAMAGDRERYLAAGFDGYVPKPIVDERVLMHTIERLLPPGRHA